MISSQQVERERGQQDILYDKVIQLLRRFSERAELSLVNRAGSKYSIVEDLVLWLNARNHCGFGQVVRTALSLKSRRMVLKQLELMHVEEMERAFDRNEAMDPNSHYIVYNQNKVLYFEDSNQHHVKKVEPTFPWNTPITNQRKVDLKIANETQELTKQLKHFVFEHPEIQRAIEKIEDNELFDCAFRETQKTVRSTQKTSSQDIEPRVSTQKTLSNQHKQFDSNIGSLRQQYDRTIATNSDARSEELWIPSISVCFVKGKVYCFKKEFLAELKKKKEERVAEEMLKSEADLRARTLPNLEHRNQNKQKQEERKIEQALVSDKNVPKLEEKGKKRQGVMEIKIVDK